jgi:hypothetical protein
MGSALWLIARNYLKFKYLIEIKVIFKTALGNETGDQMGSICEKDQKSKIKR